MGIVFLDTEFTDFLHPELLSLGLVSLDGREHYVELDLETDVGRERRQASSDFVRFGGVLDLWGLIPGATTSAFEMGKRTGEWLLSQAAQCAGRLEVAFDYSTDYELMENAVRDCGVWERVREVVTPIDVGPLTGSPGGEAAAEACMRELRSRRLARHHALADAHALRAAYMAAKAMAVQMAQATHAERVRELTEHARQHGLDESWLRTWMNTPAHEVGGRQPNELLGEPGGFDALKDLVVRTAQGVRP